MDVAGAWRRVQNKVVQLAPIGIGNELLQRTRCHTATPQRCCIRADKETDTEHLDAVGLDGTDQLTTIFLDGIRTLVFDVKHLGHRRTEDVAVQQAHLIAQACQCDSEVGGYGALAHAALA